MTSAEGLLGVTLLALFTVAWGRKMDGEPRRLRSYDGPTPACVRRRSDGSGTE